MCLQTIRAAEHHLLEDTTERSVYQNSLEKAKVSIVAEFTVAGNFQPPQPASKSPPNSRTLFSHSSFDMAQQFLYPNDPLQPGPMYFLTPGKCAIFGVCCEAIPCQINY